VLFQGLALGDVALGDAQRLLVGKELVEESDEEGNATQCKDTNEQTIAQRTERHRGTLRRRRPPWCYLFLAAEKKNGDEEGGMNKGNESSLPALRCPLMYN
jgi:hypothetical protein